jgi:threonyl-tRNA synthetase
MTSCLDFLQHVYGIFGFTFSLKLSTRPEKFLGDIETWNQAEKKLEESLNKFGQPWELNPGDGAFYGPKIDITIKDALNRRHQCATIQLDFQLPERFDLTYNPSEVQPGKKFRPVIIHRAILGSVERMMAILTESFGGRWPFWLSPRQIGIVPVAVAHYAYAEELRKAFHDAGFYVEVDLSDATLPKKVRNAELMHYNFIIVVGSEEMDSRTVNVRNRDSAEKGKGEVIALDTVIAQMKRLKEEKRNDNQLV